MALRVIKINRTVFLALLATASMLAATARVRADDTTAQDLPGGFIAQPMIGQTASWNSNPLLLLSGARQLYGSITTPELIISDRTPDKQLNLDTQINENVFNQPEFNSTDLHSKGNFNALRQIWGAGVSGQFDYDTTRTSEPSIYGFRNTQIVRHWDISVTPQITYSPLPTDKFGLSGSALTSQYETSVFTDYEVFSITPIYTHNFDPLNAGLVKFTAQHYQAIQGPRSTYDTMGPSVGWIATLTPRLSANASVGVELVQQDLAGVPTKPWSAQYVFSTDITFTGEQDKADLAASRSEYPFGNGTESLLTNFTVSDSHSLNENFSLNAQINYEYADYQSTFTGNLQSLASASGGLTYHATDHLDVTGTYQYRYETLTGIDANIVDHSVNLGLVYHPKAWAL